MFNCIVARRLPSKSRARPYQTLSPRRRSYLPPPGLKHKAQALTRPFVSKISCFLRGEALASPSLSAPIHVSVLVLNCLHNDQPTASLAVWACVVQSDALSNAVLLGRDSWTPFTQRSYSFLPPRLPANPVLRDLTLSHTGPSGASVFVKEALGTGDVSYLRCAGNSDVSLSSEAQLRGLIW